MDRGVPSWRTRLRGRTKSGQSPQPHLKAVVAPHEDALKRFLRGFEDERELPACSAEERQRMRQERSKPLLDALHAWLLLTRQKITDGTATAKALDYSLRRWQALTRFVSDGQLPVDNNHIENQIRPIAIGRNNWLFAGSLRAGQRGVA